MQRDRKHLWCIISNDFILNQHNSFKPVLDNVAGMLYNGHIIAHPNGDDIM